MLVKFFLLGLGITWVYLMARLMYRVLRSSDLELKNQEHLEVNDRFKKVVDFSKNSGRIKTKKDRVEDFLKND
jgi:membrane protein implicated in regulation of membrane protease activity